jgi:probable F420-dependent oxidoreductase
MTESASGPRDVVTAARQRLGGVGAYLANPTQAPAPVDEQRREVARLERLGYRSIWTNEQISGKDVLAHLGILLAATDRMVVGSAVATVWARHPATLHGGAALLAQAYPGRVALGVGISYERSARYAGADYGKPVPRMREYLDRMDAPPQAAVPPAADYPRVLGAIGPRMTALAAERADGAIPFGMPVDHTAASRRILGPDKLLIVGQQVVYDTDRDRARDAARALKTAMRTLNPSSPYFTNLTRFGFSDNDIATVGDAVVDATIACGDENAIAARVREQFAAGADHVLLFPSTQTLAAAGDALERLADAVLAG